MSIAPSPSTAAARSSRVGFGPAASTARAMTRMNVHMPVVAPYAELVSGSFAVYVSPPASWYSRLHISANSLGSKSGRRNAPVAPGETITVPSYTSPAAASLNSTTLLDTRSPFWAWYDDW